MEGQNASWPWRAANSSGINAKPSAAKPQMPRRKQRLRAAEETDSPQIFSTTETQRHGGTEKCRQVKREIHVQKKSSPQPSKFIAILAQACWNLQRWHHSKSSVE